MEIRRFKGKSNAAICISIDDVCPLKLPYGDFGGELANGRLGKLLWLADRHRGLKFTLFTTADWREISPLPTRNCRQNSVATRQNLSCQTLSKRKIQSRFQSGFCGFHQRYARV